MVVTGRFGVKTYSLENPAKPKLLDELSAERLKLEGDPDVDFGPPDTSAPVSTFWQNEDMDVDQDRKLLILSRDPRAYAGTTNLSPGDPNPAGATNIAGVYIVDARDPEALRLLAFQELPTGHTTTCINDCKWLWSGGPASTTTQQAPTAELDRGPPDHRHRPEQPEPPAGVPDAAGRPLPSGRHDRVLARRAGRRRRDRLGLRCRRHARLLHRWPSVGPARAPLPPRHPAGAGPVRRRRAPAVGHQRHHRRLRAQRRAPGRPQRAARRRPLPQGRAAAGHRGGLRARGGGLPQPGPVHDRLAEGLLQRRGLEVDAGQPVPPAGGRQVVAVSRRRARGRRPARSRRWRTSARRTTSTSTTAS